MSFVRHTIKPLCLSSILILTACATSPTGRTQLMLVSPESAIVESEKAYVATTGQLASEQKLVTDAKLVKRIQTITGRLVTEAVKLYPATKDWDWSVAIIDDPETVNAWCMAGGKMAIYTGIIDKLNLTDDEIAQVMGHEISHALANHTAEKMSRAIAINAGVTAAGAVAGDKYKNVALSGTALAAQLAIGLPNSRDAESEADRMGIEIATRAGYKPGAAVTLWQKMAEMGGGGQPEFLSTHPAPGNRQKKLSSLAPEMEKLNPTGAKAPAHPVKIVR